jgi:hypothetical protein
VIAFLYQALLAFMVVLLLHSLFREKGWKMQATAALALIPFLLRLLLIK